MKRTKTKSDENLIFANDPSFTAWGWVVVTAHGQVIEKGCIQTKPSDKKLRIRKGDDRIKRISELNYVLLDKIKSHNIRLILAELPHGSQNAQAAIMMGATAGILQTISDVLDIPIEWYSEGDAKKALVGKQSATKQAIIDAIVNKFEFTATGKKGFDEATADAMAIFNVALQNSNMIKMLK